MNKTISTFCIAALSVLLFTSIFLFIACSGSGGGGSSPDGSTTPFDGTLPVALCNSPLPLYDVSNPTAVVGDGTPASCTQAALQTAATGGGTIVFNCGFAAATITLFSPITFRKETVLDGGGLVTLDGNHRTRILYFESAYDLKTPRLVVQRLIFRNGQSASGGEDTAVGGGAIYRDGGSLAVIDCAFLDNQAPSQGQDIAGGAIYAFGGGETIISHSTFTNNSASNGGAIGSLNGDLIVANSTFTGNAATGSGGNPGQGGCGGAVYMDGGRERTVLCGVRIVDNRAGAIGGGFFRVSNDNTGTLAMDRTTVDSNQITATDKGIAGGLYLQGLQMAVTNSTISRNRAYYNGGIWIHTSQVQMTNVTIAENTAFGSNGGGLWLSNNPTGTLLNCTIASNYAPAIGMGAGAIFGGGLTLKNTLVSGNTAATWAPGCDKTHDDGGGNLQWPGGSLCTASPLVEDPLLGTLGDHGGSTETMVPGSTSPARSNGSDCPATDQRDQPRGSTCTIGAVEVP